MKKHQQRLRASVLALSLATACAAHAQTVPPPNPQVLPPNDLDVMRQFEERERLEQEILRQLEEQQRRDSEATKPPPQQAPTPSIPDLAGNEFQIDRIYLQGERRPPSSRRKIMAKYEGRKLGATAMLELVRDLMNDYAREGHVTTTVVLLPQNLKSGHLVLAVQWGRVKGWRFSGREATGMTEHVLLGMLPRVEGDILDIAAVDQAVEILNNGRFAATVNVAPAEETGYSWLDVQVQPRLPLGGNLGMDNSGPAKNPGDGRLRTTVGMTSRGFGADVWNAGATRRHYFDQHRAEEDSANVSMNMPLGFWDFEWRLGASRYERLQEAFVGTYRTYGDSIDHSLKIGRTLSRSKEGKTDLSLRIQRRESENFINDAFLEVNSKTYTDLVLGLSRVEQLWGGSLYADVNWGRGTRWLGADDVTIRKEGDTPALYYKYSGNVSWTRGIPLGQRRIDFGLRGGWQYSPRKLLTANKLTIGDEYTVRGFKGNSVYGDKGGYLSGTLTLPIGGGWAGFVGADVGAVQDNEPGKPREMLSGWAAGIRGNWRNASITLTHAQPIRAIRNPGPNGEIDYGAGDVLYAMATLRF